jgi:hypothetical protein
VEIPNWLKWVAVAAIIVWLFSDPKGMAHTVTELWDGVHTFFKELG